MLVRGSTDRLKLDWEGRRATGPDGTKYFIVTEGGWHTGPVVHVASIRRPGRHYSFYSDFGEPIGKDCPYIDDPLTMRGQKKVCEWDAWQQLQKGLV